MAVEHLLLVMAIFAIAMILRTWFSRSRARSRAFELQLKETERKILLSEREYEKREALERRPRGPEGLTQYLDCRRIEQQAEEQEHDARRHRLIALWTELSPKVLEAIDLLNTKLAPYSLKLTLSEAEFFGPEGYGTICTLHGPIGTVFPYDGEQPLVVTDEGLYIGGVHNWSEGGRWPLDSLTVEALADAVAEVVKSLIDG